MSTKNIIESTEDYPAKNTSHAEAEKIQGVVLGLLVGFGDTLGPLVTFPGSPSVEAIRAKAITGISAGDVGRQVALLFENGDVANPIVVGCIQSPMIASANETKSMEATLDGDTVVFSAKEQLVLKCGKASITLTAAGKVLIRGAYVLSRSSGVNRIKGGSVQIN
ncbi:MAG: DUF6484 domain-containing protein [Pseudomonadota bacterium]